MRDRLIVREVAGSELSRGAALLAAALGFSARDAIPAWHMRDVSRHGGLALGAFAREGLVGFSYGFPALAAGTRVLFSSGLAVAAPMRSQGIGRRLKLVQRRLAAERGYSCIDWTADPLSAAAMRLYLTVLGARLVGYATEPYLGLRAGNGAANDDVEIHWSLTEPAASGGAAETVEIPFDRRALSPAALIEWRRRIRTQVPEFLSAGYHGVGLDCDRAARRCWLRFERAA
jgi:predicted GNAT superfamily acetyltransferase